jgi:hypothetical protein
VLRIRDVYPESDFFHPGSRVDKIPVPGSGSASKNFEPKKLILKNKIQDVHPDSWIWIFFHPGSGSATLAAEIFYR